MNYLYFIFTTLILSVSSLVTSTYFQPSEHGGWYEFFIGFGVVSAIVTLIIIFISVANTLSDKQKFRSNCNQIRKYNKDITNLMSSIEKYKIEFKAIITEMYPQYEKEIFKSMQPQDVESLTMIMVKYPELKFDGVLNQYIEKLEQLHNRLISLEESINYTYKEILDIQEDKWIFGKVEVPNDIKVY